ncbi:hypothetical protein [Scytonema hofmannii]|nr:hypothetical protein [Scytonema hofmannii]
MPSINSFAGVLILIKHFELRIEDARSPSAAMRSHIIPVKA